MTEKTGISLLGSDYSYLMSLASRRADVESRKAMMNFIADKLNTSDALKVAEYILLISDELSSKPPQEPEFASHWIFAGELVSNADVDDRESNCICDSCDEPFDECFCVYKED